MIDNTQQPVKRASWLAAWAVSTVAAFTIGFAIAQPGDTLAAARKIIPTTPKVVGMNSAAPADIAPPVNFKEFWDLWRQIKERYHQQPVDDSTLFYGAMSGLASAVGDPYTTYFEPKSAQEFSSSLQGKFEGIGAEIGIKNDQLQVIAPLPETPAEKAGLQPGDLILLIDKQDATSFSVEKAVSLIRGKGGTIVTLLIGRTKIEKDSFGKEKKSFESFEKAIMRETILVKSVRTSYLRDGIALIEITHFNEDTADGFSAAVKAVLAKKSKGLIVDLRNDPGGYLDRATQVTSEWIGNQVVVMERRQGKITDSFRGTGPARLKDMPTILLVNQGSASASEIVAGALQDYGLAKLVGMKTFGKGSVQDVTDFPDKSSVKITIAEWLTPKGRSIDKVGMKPDIEVDRTEDDYHANRDPQLDRALDILTGTSSTAAEMVSSTKNGLKKY